LEDIARRGCYLPRSTPRRSGRSRNLVYLLEALTIHDVDEDDGRRVVTLGVPFDRTRIGHSLERSLAHGGNHLRAAWKLALFRRGAFDGVEQEPHRVVGTCGIVVDGPVLGRVAGRELA